MFPFGKIGGMYAGSRLQKGVPVSWEELHRTAKALAWRLLEEQFDGVIAITQGGLVPAAIVARELEKVVDTLVPLVMRQFCRET